MCNLAAGDAGAWSGGGVRVPGAGFPGQDPGAGMRSRAPPPRRHARPRRPGRRRGTPLVGLTMCQCQDHQSLKLQTSKSNSRRADRIAPADVAVGAERLWCVGMNLNLNLNLNLLSNLRKRICIMQAAAAPTRSRPPTSPLSRNAFGGSLAKRLWTFELDPHRCRANALAPAALVGRSQNAFALLD